MLDKLRHSIEKLSGSDARTWLFHVLVRLNMLKTSNAFREEILEEINAIQQELSDIYDIPPIQRDYQTVHIVSGESPAGSLRVGLARNSKVIGFPEFFSIGPLWRLHTEEGRRRRYEWLKDHINFSMDYMEEEYDKRIANTLKELQAIPENTPIVLWVAHNAEEQTFCRYMLQLLQKKTNDISIINATEAYKDLYNTAETQYYVRHTAEVLPEKLKEIYEKKHTNRLSDQEKKHFQKEWMELAETREVLRIWEEDAIKNVPENYFDGLLIRCAEKLHTKQGRKDFIKSARIIGEVYGQIEGHVSDAYFEYRLRSLIYNGVFEIKGIPKSMRYYSVRLK